MENKPKSQIETDKNVLDFLGNIKVKTPEDLVKLRDYVLDTLEFKPYNTETKKDADNIQWKRTASQIIQDGYVYEGKACSDIVLVFLALCKALGIEGKLLKLVSTKRQMTHSIVEVKLNDIWYKLDPSFKNSKPHPKQMTKDDTFRGEYKLWKKGKDNWNLGLDSFESMSRIFKDKNIITFPKDEWEDIRRRLDNNQVVWTIRVDKEYEKFKVGDVLDTEWNEKIEILSVKKINNGIKELEKEYQFFDKLTGEMLEELKPYNAMEIISFKKFNKVDLQENWKKAFDKYEKTDWINKPSIFAEEVLPYLEDKKTLLELGAGLGQDSLFFNEKNFSITSTDFSDYALDKAKEKDKSGNIKFLKVDVSEKLPFEDESFDVVYSHLCLQFFNKEKTQQIFDEIRRVLKKDGIFATLLNTIDDPEITEYNYEKIDEDFYKNNSDVEKRYFSVESITELTKDLFKPLLTDNKGKTYKDDIETLIRFIGIKK